MQSTLTRRELITTAALGIGALALPSYAQLFAARGFTHGVASGEPAAESVLLWTRYVADGDTRLRVEVARDTLFKRIVGGGETLASHERDHTARLIVTGLEPGRWYFFRFVAPNGATSPVGRTRTLPVGEVSRFGIGLFSCANLGFGWFNAYGHACTRADLDLIVHAGDYIYEYPRGSYPDAKQSLPGRVLEPANETITLADYRLRYACYRLDPDLQRLHQSFPMVAQWDDHEFANDTWRDGAENHQSATEGDWMTRRAIAERVYREWMPVSDEYWRTYQIGSLATLFKLETRISGRSAPADLESALRGKSDLARALVEFRDGPLNDESRTMLGEAQEAWLRDALRSSTGAKTRWQVIAQQVLMGEIVIPQEAAQWIGADAPEAVRRRLGVGLAAARAGLPYNLDSWGGFPAARRRLLGDAVKAEANLVVLAGDSHNAWAQNLAVGRDAVGVEFATPSVTSPGFEYTLSGVDPAEISRAVRARNPDLAFLDASRRGYTSVLLTPDSVTGNFHFLKTVRGHDVSLAETRTLRALYGAKRLERA